MWEKNNRRYMDKMSWSLQLETTTFALFVAINVQPWIQSTVFSAVTNIKNKQKKYVPSVNMN